MIGLIERLENCMEISKGVGDPTITLTVKFAEAIRAALLGLRAAGEEPIDMVLYCPKCGHRHVDEPEMHEGDCTFRPHDKTAACNCGQWANPPHKSHLCHGCGHVWRPSDHPTNGVAATKSGKDADTKPAAPPASAPPDTDVCRPATLLEELRVEEALVPNRRGKLYGLAADEIERRTASAPEPVFYADSEQMVDWQRGVRHGGAIDLRITSSQHPGTCDVPLYLATAHGERQALSPMSKWPFPQDYTAGFKDGIEQAANLAYNLAMQHVEAIDIAKAIPNLASESAKEGK